MHAPNKIWLSSPHMGGNELKYIEHAFADNWIAPLGPNVDGFEDDLTRYLGKDTHIAALSTGTAALHLALIACGVGPSDEVICQSMTFSASANPIAYQGALPVFVDSERDTWNMCPKALENAVVDRLARGKIPKAIIVVHLYGMPAKMDEIRQVADHYAIPVIEDAAEALGSTYKGQAAGTMGDYGVLSFNGNKIITTSGGGALVCRTKAIRDHIVFLATQARDKAPHYQHSQIGYNYRMSNIAAGIGRGQMEVLDDRVAARRGVNEFYVELFKNVPGISFLIEPDDDYFSNHWLSALLIDSSITGWGRDDLQVALWQNEIESRPLWKPMHLQPVFDYAPYYGGRVAGTLFRDGICLPSGSNLTLEEMERIATVVRQLVDDKKRAFMIPDVDVDERL